MAADPSIFQQYLNPVRSVADYRGDMDKQEQNALTLASTRLANQQAQQDAADAQAVRQAYMQSGGDTNKLRQALLAGGNVKALNAYDKSQLDTQKTQGEIDLSKAHAGKFTADTDAANYELRIKKSDQAIKDISSFTSPEQALASLQQHVQAGDVSPEQAQMIQQTMPQDKSQFPAWQIGMLQKIMAAKDRMSQLAPDANARLTAQTSAANNAATVGAIMRGQNMTDARTRESNNATMSKPFEVTGPDGQPVLVRQDKQGNITPVQGYSPKTGAEKPLNEGQSKAALFGARMEASNNILNNLEKEGTSTSVPGTRVGAGIGSVISALSSDKQQQLEQAKRDFINATLRRESGAAIAPSEFDNAEKQYFPQIGEPVSVIKQKANNRAIAIRGVQAEVPKAQRGVIKDIIGSPSPAKTNAGATVSNW